MSRGPTRRLRPNRPRPALTGADPDLPDRRTRTRRRTTPGKPAITRWTGPAEDVEARACPAAKPRAHLTPHPPDRPPAPPALAPGVLPRIDALLAHPAAA